MRTFIKKIGRIGLINRAATRKLNQIYKDMGINLDKCEAMLPGCHPFSACDFHHRKSRRLYADRDRETHIKNLADYQETIRVCRSCHSQMPPGSDLSEKRFKELRSNE